MTVFQRRWKIKTDEPNWIGAVRLLHKDDIIEIWDTPTGISVDCTSVASGKLKSDQNHTAGSGSLKFRPNELKAVGHIYRKPQPNAPQEVEEQNYAVLIKVTVNPGSKDIIRIGLVSWPPSGSDDSGGEWEGEPE